jgi:hypothetical protein
MLCDLGIVLKRTKFGDSLHGAHAFAAGPNMGAAMHDNNKSWVPSAILA